MNSYTEENISFFEALVGLLFEPRATIEILLDRENPPFHFKLVFCLFLTVFLPIFVQAWGDQLVINNADAILSILITIVFALLFFIFAEGLFLYLFGIPFTMTHLSAIICYCLAPLLLALWLVYIFNYLNNQSLSVLTYLMTGYADTNDQFLRIMPIALIVIQINILLVFFYGIKFIGQLHFLTAVAVTVLSIVPFYISLIIGVFLGDIVRSGTIEIFIGLISSTKHLGL